MAENRFTTGIKKSKEKTDDVQKKKEELKVTEQSAPETVETPTDAAKSSDTNVTPETNSENNGTDSNSITNLSKADIKAILKQTQKPKSKTHSLYLDDDVFEKLQKHAKSNKTSVSKVLNDLLKSIL